jgi:hypothetical protein
LGDYVTKHHAAIHHRATRGTFLTPKFKLDLLRKRNLAAMGIIPREPSRYGIVRFTR